MVRAPSTRPIRSRWTVLAYGTAAQWGTCLFLYGLPFAVPYLRRADHLSLAAVGLLVAAPSLGLVTTLIAWGAAADRWGERPIITTGLLLTGVCLLAGSPARRPVILFAFFFLAGAAAASVNAASGRLVMGSFSLSERGLAMGIRQTAQPLGVASAALILPVAVEVGTWAILVIPGGLCVVLAGLVWRYTTDPPRPAGGAAHGPAHRPPSPYRHIGIWRVHASSALLVVPQMAVAAFAEEYLVSARHWDSQGAGRVLAVVGLAGAVGRLAAGVWSDRVHSRLRPMRQVAAASALAMVAVGLAARGDSAWALAALAAASIISVADNGLGFTATAEFAGPSWAGRALGAQNTGQNLVAFLTPPLFGALVASSSYGTAFLLCATLPALGLFVIPVRTEAALLAARQQGSTT